MSARHAPEYHEYEATITLLVSAPSEPTAVESLERSGVYCGALIGECLVLSLEVDDCARP